MAERSTLSQGVQIGVETTPGTAVAANKKLLATSIELGIQANISTFRPSGGKFATIQAMGKEWAKAKISGQLTYTDLVYLASSNIKYAAPVQQAATAAYKWTHFPAQSAEDTVKTFTVENGSAVRAHKAAYGIVNSLGYMVTRDKTEIKGEMLMQRVTDGITLTATPTDVALKPILPSQFDYYADDASGDLGTTKLLRVFSIDWDFSNRFGPVWPIDSAQASFAAHVETEPQPLLKVVLAADAVGMGYLANARTGDKKFIRIQATGENIEDTYDYSMIHDICGVVSAVEEFKDHEGVYAIGYTFRCAYDATWGKAFNLEVINALTGL